MTQPSQQDEEMLTPMKAVWPAPPPFYKNFTKQNVNELRRLRKEAGVPSAGPSSHTQLNGEQASELERKDVDILSLSAELRYLIPPQLPTDGAFTIFGQPKSLQPQDPTLADLEIEQIYPDHASVHKNPQPHLIALARSLLTKYLHILGVLSANPTDHWEQSTKELEKIVYNMHDLINRYRPHQARESLILMMEERVERMREEIRGIEEGERKAREMVSVFEGSGQGGGAGGPGVKEGDGQGRELKIEDGEVNTKLRQERAWAMLNAEMGEG